MEKIEEKAKQYLMETIHDDNHAIKNSWINGYTTRNDEVVKMIEDEISELEQLRLTGVNGSDFEIVCTIRIQDLIDLLTKLKQPNNK